MTKLLTTLAILVALATSSPAIAKVCFSCRNAKPVRYVCAKKDTFAARHNAKRLGCDITSYSTICQCGAWVNHKRKLCTARSSFFADALDRLARRR
jgi:hypothetical protein